LGRISGQGNQAIAGAFSEVAGAIKNHQDRVNTVERAKIERELRLGLTSQFQDALLNKDLSQQKDLLGFLEQVNTQTKAALESHSGSAESKRELFENLEILRFDITNKATAASFEAGRQLVRDEVESNIRLSETRAVSDPAGVEQQLDDFDVFMTRMSKGLDENEQRDLFRDGKRRILIGGIEGLISRSLLNEAEKALTQTPGIGEFVTRADIRILGKSIAAARDNLRKANERQLRVVGPRGRLIEIDEFGQPRQLVGPLEGEETTNAPFGTGAPGGVLNAFGMSADYAAGRTTPDQDRTFMTAVTEYTQERLIKDELGNTSIQKKELPQHVKDALDARGIRLTGDAVGQTDQDLAREDSPLGPGGRTVFELVTDGLISGPGPSAGEAIGSLPIIGGGAPQMTAAREFVRGRAQRLTSILRQADRSFEGERKAIEATIQPLREATDFFEDPNSTLQSIVGVTKELQIRRSTFLSLANDPNLADAKRRRFALNVASEIDFFIKALMPGPIIENAEQMNAFSSTNPPGSKFVAAGSGGQFRVFILNPRTESQ
jgi:hypothetical protein